MKNNRDVCIAFDKQGNDAFVILVKCKKTGKLITRKLFENSKAGEMKKFIEKVLK